jgi:hypothetical protein
MVMKQHNRRRRQCRFGGGSQKGVTREGDFPKDLALKLIKPAWGGRNVRGGSEKHDAGVRNPTILHGSEKHIAIACE